ncbi:per os infectivity factor 0 (p74) protein [Glossina pallidipes salivary gland hypertrophy virus]|uniref:Per os infectivity factor 0 (P74) protein n=1 Tax=Glossina hytrovirus (isolate Glossina pallidipes/Ethiopia/Seibersdorf/-) TaxID=379529 RepID=A0A0Y0M3A9_GHVS|nr:per os infectivity factor 0 (p74) protein [Glossina pallidipes salivary gland hypertrophy virus]
MFNPPTIINYVSADRYAFERHKLLMYNYFLKYRPEIMSHVYVEIMYNGDFRDNRWIEKDRCIYVAIRGTRKFCEQCRCQINYPRGNYCQEKDMPRTFKSGNSDVDACQMACYNLYEHSKDEDGVYHRAPYTHFSEKQNCCLYEYDQILGVGLDDYNRTDEHPTPRVDTIGTGFDINFNERYTDNLGNETFRFRLNKYYCDDFKMQFAQTKCKESIGQTISSYLLSETLYKAVQYGVRWVETGVGIHDVQKVNLPPVENDIAIKTYEDWINNINSEAFFIDPNVCLHELGITAGERHLIFTTEYGWPGRLIEPLLVYKSVSDGNVIQIDYEEVNIGRLDQFKYDTRSGRRLQDEFEVMGAYEYLNKNSVQRFLDANSGEPTTSDEVKQTFIDFFANFAQAIFSTDMVINVTADLLTNMILKLSESVAMLSEKFATDMITSTMIIIMKRGIASEMAPVLLHTSIQFIKMVSKTMISAIKATSVILDVIALVDFFLMFTDIFSINRLTDDGTLEAYSMMDIEKKIENFGYGTVEFNPLFFIQTCQMFELDKNWTRTPIQLNKLRCMNTEQTQPYKYMLRVEEIADLNDAINLMLWTAEYILALEENSNGLPINWSEENKIASIDDKEQFFSIDVNLVLSEFQRYDEYTRNIIWRYKFGKIVIPILFVTLIISFFINIFLVIIVFILIIITSAFFVFYTS